MLVLSILVLVFCGMATLFNTFMLLESSNNEEGIIAISHIILFVFVIVVTSLYLGLR